MSESDPASFFCPKSTDRAVIFWWVIFIVHLVQYPEYRSKNREEL